MLTSACGEPQEPAANQVNELIRNDQEMAQNLKELARHEREEMELYTSILNKGKQNSDLESLLDQAEEHIAERRKLLEQAETLMKQTQEQTPVVRDSLGRLSLKEKRRWFRHKPFWTSMKQEPRHLRNL